MVGRPLQRRRTAPRRLALAALCLVVAAAASPGLAQGMPDLTVERGDVLSVTVQEDPTLSREAPVDAFGRIVLPQVGSVEVAGQGLDAVGERIAVALAERDILRAPTVTVEVASYRPFYVGGAVTQQGAIPYEPGLTVRHALLLAGGLERDDEAGSPSVADLLEINAEWRATTFALFEVNSRIARLEAELDLSPEVRRPDAAEVGEAEAEAVASLDAALLADRLEIRGADQQHLRDLMAAVDVELDVLSEQSDHLDEEAEIQGQDLDNARELLANGLISQPRVHELEREQLALTRTRLDVQAYEARARQNRETIDYELENAERAWRIDTRAALRDAVLERTGLAAEVELLAAELLASGIRLSDRVAPAELEPEVVIYRLVGGEEQALGAGMTTPVLPGDILDVAIAAPPQG
jgi:polysaccharide biosynthesis/export protein